MSDEILHRRFSWVIKEKIYFPINFSLLILFNIISIAIFIFLEIETADAEESF